LPVEKSLATKPVNGALGTLVPAREVEIIPLVIAMVHATN
jgi:hypothetical protein